MDNRASAEGPTVARRPVAASLTGVSKRFGDGHTEVTALDKVSLDVHCGEMLLIAGPSGCGKTTLLSVLTGVLDVTEGAIEVMGWRLDTMDQAAKTEFRRNHIGFVFQQHNLVPTLTAAENVAVPLLLAGQRFSRAIQRAHRVLEMVNLGDRARFLPGELSGGQQQRVAIARALASEPRLIVCDEPTAALDGHNGHQAMELLRSFLSTDRAIVVVTHDNRIFPFGDRLAKMRDARIESIDEMRAANGSTE